MPPVSSAVCCKLQEIITAVKKEDSNNDNIITLGWRDIIEQVDLEGRQMKYYTKACFFLCALSCL